MYFDDWTSGKEEYNETLLELRAIQKRFETFLEDNPNYFSEGCKIEITTKLSRKTAIFSDLDTLAVGFSFDDEELELVKSLCPNLEIKVVLKNKRKCCVLAGRLTVRYFKLRII